MLKYLNILDNLKSPGFGRAGSSPAAGTKKKQVLKGDAADYRTHSSAAMQAICRQYGGEPCPTGEAAKARPMTFFLPTGVVAERRLEA